MYHRSVDEGFAGMRATGETGWTCNGHPGLDRWFEYESMLNIVVEDVPFSSVICQYDANRLGGANLYEVLRVHPLMIVRGQILHNPYYEAPAQYLSRRRASAQAQTATQRAFFRSLVACSSFPAEIELLL